MLNHSTDVAGARMLPLPVAHIFVTLQFPRDMSGIIGGCHNGGESRQIDNHSCLEHKTGRCFCRHFELSVDS